MRITTMSTGLALVLGLGLGPAYAAGASPQSAGTAAQTQTEAQAGGQQQPQQQTGTVPQAGGGQGAPASELGGAAVDCDADGDGFITTEEVSTCAGQQFGAVSGGQDYMTPDQFGAMGGNVQGGETPMAEIDRNGDGQISREEWMQWREEGFAAATQGSEGRMPSADYETWHRESWVGGEGGGAGATTGGSAGQQGGASGGSQ